MDFFIHNILTIQALIGGGMILVVVYLIFRRVDIKGKEEFEDREN